MAAIFPTAVVTQAQLWTLVNGISTTLNGAIDNLVTTVTVVDTTNFPSTGYFVVDQEVIKYTGKTGTTFTGCTRGADGSTAVSHITASTASHYYVADHHNIVTLEIAAIEADINARFGIGASSNAIAVPSGVSFTIASTAGLAITPTTNQIVLGTTRTVTINAPTPASASRIWTIPDITAAGTFAALEGSQTFSGQKTFSAALLGASGTVSLPGLSFSADPDCGVYRVGANDIALAVNGAITFEITTSSIDFYIAGSAVGEWNASRLRPNTDNSMELGSSTQGWSHVYASLASNSTPAYTFTGDADTGMYSSGANTINWTTGGTARMSLDTTSLTTNLPLYHAAGSLANPGITWGGDTSTGIYKNAANQYQFVSGGSLVGQVDNSGITMSSRIVPSVDNTQTCGTAALRWNLVRGVTITSGDLRFENDWVMIEGAKVGLPDEGIVVVSPSGKRYKIALTEVDDSGAFKKKWAKHELDHFEKVDPRCDCNGACIHDPAVVQEVFKVKAA